MLLIDVSRFRKKVLTLICFSLLIWVLMFTYRTAETNARITEGNVQFKDYSGLNGMFTYKLPSNWKTTLQSFPGGEILYHNDFETQDKKMHGYVEIWNLNKPLINFIKESQKSSVGIVAFKNYTVEPAKIDGRDGYILQYSRRDDKNKYFKAFEVFILDRDNTFHRFAFYMDEALWKDEYRGIFLNIAATARLK